MKTLLLLTTILCASCAELAPSFVFDPVTGKWIVTAEVTPNVQPTK